MDAHARGIDHENVARVSCPDGCQNAAPIAGGTPPHEAVVKRRARAPTAPERRVRSAGAQPPQDAVDHPPVVPSATPRTWMGSGGMVIAHCASVRSCRSTATSLGHEVRAEPKRFDRSGWGRQPVNRDSACCRLPAAPRFRRLAADRSTHGPLRSPRPRCAARRLGTCRKPPLPPTRWRGHPFGAPGVQAAMVAPMGSATPCSARKRSASRAAMQPIPAAVTACRYTSSVTSPAANTPGTLVRVEPSSVQT